MRFELNENVPTSAKALLQDAGYDATIVAEEGLAGVSDRALAAACKDTGAVLISLDLDFANIREFPPGTHPGIIVFRLPRLDAESVSRSLGALLTSAVLPEVAGAIVIVEEDRIRMRRQE